MSDDEIDQMVKDAEIHAEEDRKFEELVTARNQADAMIHATEKSLTDLGDKVSAEDKTSIEAAIKDLREVLDGEDKEAIEAKTAALTEVAGKLAEQMYADSGDAQAEPSEQEQPADDVVDAEFEEVKNDK